MISVLIENGRAALPRGHFLLIQKLEFFFFLLAALDDFGFGFFAGNFLSFFYDFYRRGSDDHNHFVGVSENFHFRGNIEIANVDGVSDIFQAREVDMDALRQVSRKRLHFDALQAGHDDAIELFDRRCLAYQNHSGAAEDLIRHAVRAIDEAGSAEGFTEEASGRRQSLWKMGPLGAVALEIALGESVEDRQLALEADLLHSALAAAFDDRRAGLKLHVEVRVDVAAAGIDAEVRCDRRRKGHLDVAVE